MDVRKGVEMGDMRGQIKNILCANNSFWECQFGRGPRQKEATTTGPQKTERRIAVYENRRWKASREEVRAGGEVLEQKSSQ